MMRITGGTLKNKPVMSYKDRDGELRPTSSRIREVVFNLLKHGKFLSEVDFVDAKNPDLINGRIIADLYCGTGIMGLEAISRGAQSAIFVDMNDRTLDVARKNAVSMGVEGKCLLIRANATSLPYPSMLADVIFCDPPYEKFMLNATLKSIAKNKWLRQSGVVICEHSKFEKLEDILNDVQEFKLIDQRDYNNTFLSIFKFSE